MKSRTLVLTEKIRETNFQIFVSTNGHFYADYDGDEISNPTLEGLKKRLLELTKRKSANLAIDFWRWQKPSEYHREPGSRGKLVHGIITGLHASNRNLLIKMDGDKPEQETSWNSGHECHLKLTKDEQEAYTILCRQQEDVNDAVAAFIAAHEFDAKAAVRAVLGETVDEEE